MNLKNQGGTVPSRIYHRERYLKKIRPFFQSDMIKVITGIRRCGKSFLMLSIIEELEATGIATKDIIYLNLDKRGYRSVKTPERLEAELEGKIVDDDFKYSIPPCSQLVI